MKKPNLSLPKALLLGGPDVDTRIKLMQVLSDEFAFSVAGSSLSLRSRFAATGFTFFYYPLGRGSNPFLDVCTLFYLWQLIRRFRPHIVHTFDTKPGVWGRLAARWAGVPIIIGTLPGLGALYANDRLSTRLLRSVYQPLQKLACHFSDLTIFQNQYDAQQFIAGGVVPESKTIVISGSGVETDKLRIQKISLARRKQVRAELGISDGALLVTMVSRLISSKGVLEFGSAARIVKHHNPEVAFLLIGPHDEDSVDRLTTQDLSQLSQDVIWPGTRTNIATILATSDIFVLPSFYREGIPRVLLEAASMGLPIITTDSPGCREVVEDGFNGFLVPVRDPDSLAQAIIRLATDLDLRRRFGRRSRERAVILFDLSVVTSKTRSVYLKLLAQKRLLPLGETS